MLMRKHPAKTVADRLQISAATLRTWTRKFAAVLDDAPAAGKREYSDGDIERLEALQRSLAAGDSEEAALARAQQSPAPPAATIPVENGDGDGSIRALIADRAASLPRKQRRLAEMLLNSPEEIVFGTLRSVAKWSGISPLTILRLAKSLGFEGYHEFQSAARAWYLSRANANRPSGVSKTSGVAATLDQQKAHLLDVAQRIDAAELDAVCATLEGAKRVFVCSTEPATMLAGIFTRQLFYAGITATAIPAVGVDATVQLNELGKDDLVVGIHLSMIFRDVYHALQLARGKGAATIAIGGTPVSPLAKTVDHFLYAHAEGKTFHFSLVGLVALTEVVVARLVERNPEASAAIAKTILDFALEERLVITPSTR